MSLNYGTLKEQVIEDAHKQGDPDVTAKADDFVRSAEGVIARRLRAVEMLTRHTFDDTQRVDSGIYTLPAGWLQEGVIWNNHGRALDKVSLLAIRRYSKANGLHAFAPLSSTEIEFRGVPGEGSTFEAMYFRRPDPFTDDADTNELLTDHEAIYIAAAKSALFIYTQDLELASAESQIAIDAIETLNEQAGRLLASADAEGAYNLSSFGGY